MADGRQSRGLVLPSQPLSHDEKNLLIQESGWTYAKSMKLFPGLSSPVESELCSGETGSEEDDDYVSELTRQMAEDMLDDCRSAARTITIEKDEKSWGSVGSPQSTLWSPLGSSQGSSEGPSLAPSPPHTPSIGKNGSPVDVETSRSEILSNQQQRAFQLYEMKQEKIINRESSLRRRREAQLEHQVPSGSGPGTRAVSLAGSVGTGVFLPRETEKPAPSRNKEACSTVLIPARVVQALKLHYDKTGTSSRLNIGDLPPYQDALMSLKGLEKGHLRTASGTSEDEKGHSLPQEWTY